MKPQKGRAVGRFYSHLISTRTTLVFLSLFAILFFVGTVFPQSVDPERIERYRETGGRMAALVGALGFLNIFRSAWFGILTSLFSVHLFFCSIHRLGQLRKRMPIRLFSREDLLGRDHSFSVSRSDGEAEPDVEAVLRRFGFRRRKYYSEGSRVMRIVCEKGLSFRWLSWLYHICFLLAIVGFCLSYLFAFESELTIVEGEKKAVALTSPDTNWQRLHDRFGLELSGGQGIGGVGPEEPRTIEIKLEEFITEYTEKAELEYPARPLARFVAAWGFGGREIRYKMPEMSLYPRDWFSVLGVYEDGVFVKGKRIEVNDPLRHAGLTFYQMAYDYEFDLEVGEEIIEGIKIYEPFTIPQMEGEFRVATPRLGTFYRLDGRVEELTPSAGLEHRPPTRGGHAKWTAVGEMLIGRPTQIMRAEMRLYNLVESSILSYRHDPGVPLLWVAAIGLLILMCARIYLPWYQVRCHVEGAQVTISIRVIGLFARPSRLVEKLSRTFSGGS
jgi:cytochrome c biogenesis protein ResB